MTPQTMPEPTPAVSDERQEQGAPDAGAGAPDQNAQDRPYLPWRGKATRKDKALLGAILGVTAVLLVMWPMRPFLIASHPVLLEFVTGSKAAIGAASAFARLGEIPLWLVVLAGTVGMIKFNWLFWWTGRLWGRGIVDMFARSKRAQRFADRAENMNPWLVRVAVVVSYVPGVPRALVHAVAGWTGMPLGTFLALDLLGAATMTGIVAGCGYALGQGAVDLIIAIDNHALWISLVIAVAIAIVPVVKAQRAAERAARQS